MVFRKVGGGDSKDASKGSIKRLLRELQAVRGQEHFKVMPMEDNFYEWRFVVHNLPADCPYHGGVYQGTIYFPAEYPLRPPSIVMLTPNGRFQVNTRLCLSATEFHPESWSPSWGCDTLLKGFLSFWLDESDPETFGTVQFPSNDASLISKQRKKLAKDSMAFNKQDTIFCDMFPTFLSEDYTPSRESSDELLNPAASKSTSSKFVPQPVAQPSNDAAVDILSEESAPVCYICRDEDKPEPLIRPCKCTGTMGHVHASCIEEWVNAHRQLANEPDIPRCSVCRHPYNGIETLPSAATVVSQR